jgi:hypothetical protein
VTAAHGTGGLVEANRGGAKKTQQTIDDELLDGQNKVEVQVSLIETLVEQGGLGDFPAADRQRGARAVDGQGKVCRSQRHHANIDAHGAARSARQDESLLRRDDLAQIR